MIITIPAALVARPVVWVPIMVFVGFVLATLGYRIARQNQHELLALAGLDRVTTRSTRTPAGVLVDTSAAIDGRMLSVARAGFLSGPLLVPGFVLEELQSIADSSDGRRRRRGRRGLEILDVLSKECGMRALDYELPEVDAVDAKLIQLARRLEAPLLTTDHNLQKVAELQGVRVLNINRLADAVRPAVVSGDKIQVRIEAEGREERQGVGYMDDGTMVVVSDASGKVGEIIDAIITSAHQTSVGRMLFARLGDDDVGVDTLAPDADLFSDSSRSTN